MNPNEFNPELFKQVVKSNLDRFVNSCISKTEVKAAMTGRARITEDKTRELAREYFIKLLSESLNEYL